MKSIVKVFVMAVSMGLYSCAGLHEDSSAYESAKMDVFMAVNEEDKLLTKTIRKDDGSVNWLAHEDINLFYGSQFSAKFSSDNSEESSRIGFRGFLDGINYHEDEYFVALYPFRKTNSFDGTYATIALPDHQTGVERSFSDDLFISAAKTTDRTLRFYNVCGGVMFSLSRSDVKSITFKGNNNENIAGTAKMCFNQETGFPEIVEFIDSKTEITVSASQCFDEGTFYYIVLYPSELPNGYTITYKTTSGEFVERVDSGVQIKRSVFGKLSMVGPVASTYVGDVSFKSKTQIENFSKKRYDHITGDVTISGTELTTLSMLDNVLTEIDGSFTIDCSSLTSLDGLYGLRKIGGSLIIKTHSLSNLEGLNNLETIDGSIEINNNIKTFEGLDKITRVGRNIKLSKVSSFKGLDGLSEVGGDLIIDSGSFNSFSGLDKLKIVRGNFELISDASQYADGVTVVDLGDLVDFSGLSNLSEIGGDFQIRSFARNNYLPNTAMSLPNLSNFNGLNNLKTVGGNFVIRGTAAASRSSSGVELYSLRSLSSFNGLDNLTTVGGDFVIESSTLGFGDQYTPSKAYAFIMEGLKSLEGLNSLTYIGGSLRIESSTNYDEYSKPYMHNSSMTSLVLSGLHSLLQIGSDVIISKGTDFDMFDNLSSIGGTFSCKTSVSGVEKLTNIPSSLEIDGSVTGLNNVELVNGNLSLSSPKITGLSSLKSINGDLTITKTTDVSGLSNLSEGVNDVTISNSPELYDFTSLIPAAKNMKGTWYVNGCGYNPTKYQMNNGQSKP